MGTVGASVTAQTPAFTPVAPVRTFELLKVYPHDVTAYTEGLQYIGNGQLLEGTGYWDRSDLRRVDLATGEVIQRVALGQDGNGDAYFGEGITLLGDALYQLTWQSNIGFTYDPTTFERTGTFDFEGEGWGLTTDGASLIMSNGSDQIMYRDPDTFGITSTISVRDGEQPVQNLNELEYIDGVIWANVYKTDLIARIDPATGIVIDWLDLTPLHEQAAAKSGGTTDVLNGIAWREDTGTALVTGKWWPTLYEIELTGES